MDIIHPEVTRELDACGGFNGEFGSHELRCINLSTVPRLISILDGQSPSRLSNALTSFTRIMEVSYPR